MSITAARFFSTLFAAVAMSLAGVSGSAAQQTQVPAQAPALAPKASPDYVIGPQDVLAISDFDQADLSGKYAVELDGTLAFPLVGRIKAGGLKIREFEDELRSKLADGFFKDPQIVVGVDQYHSQRVFVVGEVRVPGTYALTRDTTLIELLSRAGSTTQTASDQVLVIRAQGPDAKGPILPSTDETGQEVLHINLKDLQSGALQFQQNVDLHDGDTVFVAKAEEAYVFGEVKLPGSYPIKSDTTVLQILSLAGGVTPNSAIGRIKIVRFVDGKKTELTAKPTDVVRPGDTITVPERYF